MLLRESQADPGRMGPADVPDFSDLFAWIDRGAAAAHAMPTDDAGLQARRPSKRSNVAASAGSHEPAGPRCKQAAIGTDRTTVRRGSDLSPILVRDRSGASTSPGAWLRAHLMQRDLRELLQAPRGSLKDYFNSLGVPIEQGLTAFHVTNAFQYAVFGKVAERHKASVAPSKETINRFLDTLAPHGSRPPRLASCFDVLLELEQAGHAASLRSITVALKERGPSWNLPVFMDDQPASAIERLVSRLPTIRPRRAEGGGVASSALNHPGYDPTEASVSLLAQQERDDRGSGTFLLTRRPLLAPVLPYADPRAPRPAGVSRLAHCTRQFVSLDAKALLSIDQPVLPSNLQPLYDRAGMSLDPQTDLRDLQKAFDSFVWGRASRAGRVVGRGSAADISAYLDRLPAVEAAALTSQLDILTSFEKSTGYRCTATATSIRTAIENRPRWRSLPTYSAGQLQRLAASPA